jgi:hypothetical protein
MRRPSVALLRIALLIVALAALALPGLAAAKPGFQTLPRSRTEQVVARGANGYTIYLVLQDRLAFLTAFGPESKGNPSITYERAIARPPGNDVSFDLGRAGRIDAHFVPGKVERTKQFGGCVGGQTVTEKGALVGTFDFHPPGGVTSLHRHRLNASVIHDPKLLCHESSRAIAIAERFDKETRLLVAGTPSGDTRFTATTYPAATGVPPYTLLRAERRRHEGGLTIIDSASAPLPTTAFAAPRLDRLPAAATVEPPAPFSGSAAFDQPSTETATVSGDLAVDLPEAGEVSLTGPGTAAGLCLGHDCTKSLPKPLRPPLHAHGFFAVSVTSGSWKPAS